MHLTPEVEKHTPNTHRSEYCLEAGKKYKLESVEIVGGPCRVCISCYIKGQDRQKVADFEKKTNTAETVKAGMLMGPFTKSARIVVLSVKYSGTPKVESSLKIVEI